VTLQYLSPAYEEGYPGNLLVTMTYALTDKNVLVMEMNATTDEETPVNLCHHGYWNLRSHSSGSVLDHELKLNCNRFTPVSSNLIPTGELRSVKGTPLDFSGAWRKLRPAVETLAKPDCKLGFGTGGGLDFNFEIASESATAADPIPMFSEKEESGVLTRSSEIGKRDNLRWAASLRDPSSGREMHIYTNQPGIQAYTANFVRASSAAYKACKDGATYDQYGAICLETQNYPNAVNQASFPRCVLRVGETYRHITHHAFKF